MGLCSSKSSVSLVPKALVPNALVLNADDRSQAPGSSRLGTPTWEEQSSFAHVTKVKVEAAARGGSCVPNHPAKGYLELGGKGEGEPLTSREAEEEEDTEAEEQEELLHISDSEGSLKSEFLE